MSSDPSALLPLRSQDLQILLALHGKPRHAYGLAKSVEQQANGVRLEIGSLYRMLARLTAAGVIEGLDPPSNAKGHSARRRYYRTTEFGRRVMEAEVARLQAVLRQAKKQKLRPLGERR